MCDTVAIVEDGRVLFAKNSDRDPNEAQVLQWQPAADHDTAVPLRCTWIEVEQVERTNAVLLSRPFWMWGCEMGANEHGVTIGNEAVFTNQPYAATGLTGMDLIRLALERAATAQAAVEAITELMGRYGQGGGCGHERRSFTYHNSFIVADRASAFVLETAGHHWAVEEVRGARSISNGLTIPGFAERHADRLRTTVSACRPRRARTTSLAESATGPLDLFALLRDDGAGQDTPAYSPINGAMSAPNMKAGGLLANSQTTASWVSVLSPASDRHFATATAGPDTSLFKPVGVHEPLDLGPIPTDHYDEGALWWRHEVLHRAVDRDPAALRPLFVDERDATERRWVTQQTAPKVAFDEAGDLERRWTQRVVDAGRSDRRPVWTRRYWRTRNRRAGLTAAGRSA